MITQEKKRKNNNFSIQEAAAKVFPVIQQERTQSFLLIALTFLALSIFGLFAINPTITTIIQLQKQLADNQLVDKQLNEKIANLSILQTKYDSLQNDLSLALAAVPESHKMPLLLAQIQAVGIKENVTIQRIQTDPLNVSLASNGSPTAVSFSIDAQGTPDTIKQFIATLATFERIVVLDTITVTNTNKTTQLEVKGKAYFKTF